MSSNETLLTKAYHNLRCAEDIYKMEEGDEAFLNYCGYHLQQAVELSIKYILEINGITPPFVHEIEQLIYLANENNIDLFLTDYISDHAEMFSSWEAKTRYVLNFRLEREKIKTAIKEVDIYLEGLSQVQEKDLENKRIPTIKELATSVYEKIKDKAEISFDDILNEIKEGIENSKKPITPMSEQEIEAFKLRSLEFIESLYNNKENTEEETNNEDTPTDGNQNPPDNGGEDEEEDDEEEE